MKRINFISILIFSISMVYTQEVRLSKSVFKSNDFVEVMQYFYTPNGKIKKIVQSQDGKPHATISDFQFNEKGLLRSYITTFSLKISPQKSLISYDDQDRISTFKIIKTEDNKVVKNRNYSYEKDFVTVYEPVNNSYKTNYFFNKDGDITKMEDVWNPNTVSTRLYEQYDFVKNPLVMTGGFLKDQPISKHNSLADNYVNIYLIKRKLQYSKKLENIHKTGGPKIPIIYKNNLLIKAVETRFDEAYDKIMPISTTTYEYITLK